MERLGGDKDLLAGGNCLRFARNLQAQLAVHHHQELIRIVDIIFPKLPRRVHPKSAGIAPLGPVLLDFILVHRYIACLPGLHLDSIDLDNV